MSDKSKIEPAMGASGWESRRQDILSFGDIAMQGVGDEVGRDVAARLSLIALNNDALPDSDPRKITWAMVDELRKVVSLHEWRWGASMNAIADALASYLPPR